MNAAAPNERGDRAARATTLIGVAALVVLAAVPYLVRNQESRSLDDAARLEAPGDFAHLSDGMVHYELAGPDSAETVVLVHGFSVPSYIWDTTFTRLQAGGYRVLRYDTYGRGYSDRPNAPYDAALTTRQLRELLDSLQITGPVHLVGLSMGGRVVANFALAHRERVQSVTLVDPAYAAAAALPWLLRLTLVGSYVFAVVRAPQLPESQLGDFVHPELHPDWPERYRVQMRYRGFRRALLSTLREQAGRDDGVLYAQYGALGIPTLLVWGREDKTVPFAFSDSVRTRVPGIRVVPVDSAGHLPHMEQPAVVHQALFEFLQQHARGARPPEPVI